jgi:D-lactate dehydrogenase
MKVAVYDTKPYDREYFLKEQLALGSQAESLRFEFFDFKLNESTIPQTADFSAICVFVNDVVNQRVVSRLAELGIKKIVLRCAGYNQVDLKACEVQGIEVWRVPAYSPWAVAEHAVALLLTLNRKTHKAYQRVREGNFCLHGLVGFDVHGKTIGVIGTGKIGSAFCHIMLGFGCRVLATDLNPDPDLQARGVKYVSLDALLAQSDVVSLHVPLNSSTYHLMSAERLKQMKKGAYLINTSRGALVDTRGLIEVLKKNQLGGAALDVYEEEQNYFFNDWSAQVIPDDVLARLLTFPQVLLTSHQGFLTDEALRAIARTTIENLLRPPVGTGGLHN